MKYVKKMKGILAVLMTALILLQSLSAAAEQTTSGADAIATEGGSETVLTDMETESQRQEENQAQEGTQEQEGIQVQAETSGEEGTIASGTSANITWVIAKGGKLTVSGTGDLDRTGKTGANAIPWYEYRNRITSAEVNVTGMTDGSYLFYGCNSLGSIDLNGLETEHMTNMRRMFSLGDFNQTLKSLDVSKFDTSNVTDMSYMFNGCTRLTSLDVSKFDTSNVTNMSAMFKDCMDLKSLDVSKFNTANVTNMSEMFYYCNSFSSLDLSSFDATNVTDVMSMSNMFFGCEALTAIKTPRNVKSSSYLPGVRDTTWHLPDGTAVRQLPQNETASIELIRVAEIAGGISGNIRWWIDMNGKLTVSGTGDLDRAGKPGANAIPWHSYAERIISAKVNVTGMTDGSYLFYGCDGLISIDLSGLETEHMTNMSHMFDMLKPYGSIGGTIDGGHSILKSLDVSKFNTANVTNMSHMFSCLDALENLDLKNFDTSKVTDMSSMFYGCSGLKSLDVSGFNTVNVRDMNCMFWDCNGLSSLDVSSFDTSKVGDMRSMFYGCSGLKSLDVSSFNTASVNVSGLDGMFYRCSSLSSLDLSSFNMSKVRVIDGMFFGCSGLVTIKTPFNVNVSIDLPKATDRTWHLPDGTPVSQLPLNEATSIELTSVEELPGGKSGDITWMIDKDGKLTVSGTGDLDRTGKTGYNAIPWYEYRDRITSAEVNVTGMTNGSYLFYGCFNMADMNLSGLETEHMTNMSHMFDMLYNYSGTVTEGNVRLKSLDVSKFNTANVMNMSNMFSYLSALENLDLKNFDTSKVMDMRYMFDCCSSLGSLDLSSFDAANVTNMSYMLSNCNGLTTIKTPVNVKVSVSLPTLTDRIWHLPDGTTVSNMPQNEAVSIELTCVEEIARGKSGDIIWVIDKNGKLTVSGTGDLDRTGKIDYNAIPWYPYRSRITSAEVNVTGMTDGSYLLYGCYYLRSVDVSGLKTENMTNMSNMFSGCSGLKNLDISGFDMSSVTAADGMTGKCSGLTSVNAPLNVKVSAELPVVTDMVWRLPDWTLITELPQNLTESVLLTRHEKPIPPNIVTTDEDLNGTQIIRVRYVPYSVTVKTDNLYEWNKVTFSVSEGRLPQGLKMYPETGELYGVPLEAGSFTVTVKAEYSSDEFETSYAKLTVIVLEDSDEAVSMATDEGYELKESVPPLDLADMSEGGGQTLVSVGEYETFVDVYLDGTKLEKEVDYSSEPGSTRITIRNQTLAQAGSGKHTLGVEFREEDNTLKRASQRIEIQDTRPGDNGGDEKPGDGNGEDEKPDNGNGEDEKPDDGNGDDQKPDDGNGDDEKPDDGNGDDQKPDDGNGEDQKSDDGNGEDEKPDNGNNGGQTQDSGNDNDRKPDAGNGDNQNADISGGNGESTGTGESVGTGEGVHMGEVLANIAYTIMPGDTLWKIAQKIYGTGSLWKKIYSDNSDVIKDPGKIYVGQQIQIRPVDGTVQSSSESGAPAQGTAGMQSYKVMFGDTLWQIARKMYGIGKLWVIIYQENLDVIADPNHIRQGQELVIPER